VRHVAWPDHAEARTSASAPQPNASKAFARRGGLSPYLPQFTHVTRDQQPAQARSGPPSVRQRAPTDAAPCLTSFPPQGHSGRHRRRCALPVPLIPATPHPPLEGSADRSRSSRERLGRSSQRSWRLSAQSCAPPKAGTSVLASLVPRLCTVLPQGSCVKVWPSAALAAGAVATGRADTPGTHGVRGAHPQDGHRRRAASEGKRAGQAGFGNRHDACRRQGARSRLARSGAIHRLQAAHAHGCSAWRCNGVASTAPGWEAWGYRAGGMWQPAQSTRLASTPKALAGFKA